MEPRTTAIVNIGILLTGDLRGPIAAADSLLVEDGRIAAIGGVAAGEADRTIDIGGATVGPGLIDSHCHVVLGDFTPARTRSGSWRPTSTAGSPKPSRPGRSTHRVGRPTARAARLWRWHYATAGTTTAPTG